MVSIGLAISIDTVRLAVGRGLRFEVFKIIVCLSQHPNGEGELEVGIGDRACLIEHPFNGFLRPRSILDYQKGKSWDASEIKWCKVRAKRLTGF